MTEARQRKETDKESGFNHGKRDLPAGAHPLEARTGVQRRHDGEEAPEPRQ